MTLIFKVNPLQKTEKITIQMDKVIEKNTDGLRAQIALDLGMTKQGLASKLNAKPLSFLQQITVSLRQRSEIKALTIYADIRARLDSILFPTNKRWSLVETVRLWQAVFVGEVETQNRWNLLQAWRELVALGNLRIAELTEVLEGKPKFGLA